MRPIVTLMLALGALCTASAAALADARGADEAYDKGDYAGVIAQCKAAAEAGDASCENFIGLLYAEGKGVARDWTEAARWFRRAADQGHIHAAHNLAFAYETGQGVPKDLPAAKKWYRQAAEHGMPEAAFNLGVLLVREEKDATEAVKWFRRAAAQGLARAEAAMGLSYEEGQGVRRNYKSAAKWYDAAAEQGDADAAGHLATLYERGLGIETDLEEAYFWYKIALKGGAEGYKRENEAGLKRVTARLSKQQIAAAEESLRDWRPQAAEAAAPRPHRRKGKGDPGGRGLYATGSGFFVSASGHLLTNNHVVAECHEVRVTEGEKGTPARLVAADVERDLAVLQVPHATSAAIFRGGERVHAGESVVVVGFPLSGLLTSEPIVSTGIVSALAGPRDDRRLLQMSAPIQPGNSGGPLLDASAHVVGVVVASLSTMKLAKATGVIPENINFAVKGDEAKAFLAAHGIAIATEAAGAALATAAVAERALAVTVRVECWR
jgi:uncharacterized protein